MVVSLAHTSPLVPDDESGPLLAPMNVDAGLTLVSSSRSHDVLRSAAPDDLDGQAETAVLIDHVLQRSVVASNWKSMAHTWWGCSAL